MQVLPDAISIGMGRCNLQQSEQFVSGSHMSELPVSSWTIKVYARAKLDKQKKEEVRTFAGVPTLILPL